MNAFGGMTLVDYLYENEMKDIVIKKIAKIMKEPNNTDTGVKVFFQSRDKQMGVDDIFASVRKVVIGDDFTAKGIDGDVKKFTIQKPTHGDIPTTQNSFIGKAIGDEIVIKSVKYIITDIG